MKRHPNIRRNHTNGRPPHTHFSPTLAHSLPFKDGKNKARKQFRLFFRKERFRSKGKSKLSLKPSWKFGAI